MANRINLGAVKGETGATGAQGLTGANGQDGITPHIENGYWYIGSTNQNVKAKGDTWGYSLFFQTAHSLSLYK